MLTICNVKLLSHLQDIDICLIFKKSVKSNHIFSLSFHLLPVLYLHHCFVLPSPSFLFSLPFHFYPCLPSSLLPSSYLRPFIFSPFSLRLPLFYKSSSFSPYFLLSTTFHLPYIISLLSVLPSCLRPTLFPRPSFYLLVLPYSLSYRFSLRTIPFSIRPTPFYLRPTPFSRRTTLFSPSYPRPFISVLSSFLTVLHLLSSSVLYPLLSPSYPLSSPFYPLLSPS